MLEGNAAAWFFIFIPRKIKRENHSKYEKMSRRRVMPETEKRFGHFFMRQAPDRRAVDQARFESEDRYARIHIVDLPPVSVG